MWASKWRWKTEDHAWEGGCIHATVLVSCTSTCSDHHQHHLQWRPHTLYSIYHVCAKMWAKYACVHICCMWLYVSYVLHNLVTMQREWEMIPTSASRYLMASSSATQFKECTALPSTSSAAHVSTWMPCLFLTVGALRSPGLAPWEWLSTKRWSIRAPISPKSSLMQSLKRLESDRSSCS